MSSLEASRRYKRKVCDETRASATYHYTRWTPLELALLADESLDARVLAGRFGRTFYAVQNKRRKMKGQRT